MKTPSVSSSTIYCVKERRACVGLVDKYLNVCLCNTRDKLSFASGILSLICWVVTEIPQMLTNFRAKSSHSISFLFLLASVIGDIFNLVGCLLEPVTLPTQYYTALLCMIATMTLVLQCLYYDYVYKWWKSRKANSNEELTEDAKRPLKPPKEHSDDDDDDDDGNNSDVVHRSMMGSPTPPERSCICAARSAPSASTLDGHLSSGEEDVAAAATTNKKMKSQPKPIPRYASYGTFLATSLNLPRRTKALLYVSAAHSGRKLLEHRETDKAVLGQVFGWMMTAVYTGGQISQIDLNIKRGSFEGLNPLMFILSLLANVTYLASILIRSMEWDNIKANLPWLFDAIVCIGLHLFMISQYLYYAYLASRSQM